MNHGTIRVEPCESGETPCVITRIIVSAKSRDEAHKVAVKENTFKVTKSDSSLTVEDDSEGSSVGGIHLGGNYSGGISIGNISIGNIVGGVVVGGGTFINGVRVTPGMESGSPQPQKEIVIKLPRENEHNFRLRNQAGDVLINSGRGRADLFTQAGKIEIGEFIGSVQTGSQSGKVTIDRLAGELSGNVTSGNIKVKHMRGPINLHATSGGITISDLVVVGKSNRIDATSGSVSLGISNMNLRLRASTSSGDIDVPSDFVKTRASESKAKKRGATVIQHGGSVISIGGGGGGSFVEGYFGAESEVSNASEINVNATSGSVTIERTQRSVQEILHKESSAELARG